MTIREAMRDRARVWLIENNHHACDALVSSVPKEDDVAYLAGLLADVRNEALRDAAECAEYHLPTAVERIRALMSSPVVAQEAPPLRPLADETPET